MAGETASGERSCAICGADNPATNRFCGTCGAPLPEAVAEKIPEVEGERLKGEEPRSVAPPQTQRQSQTLPAINAPTASTSPRPHVSSPDVLSRERELARLLTLANVQRMRAQIVDSRQTLQLAEAIAATIDPVHSAPLYEQQADMAAAEERWEMAQNLYEKALEVQPGRASAERKYGEIMVRLSDQEAIERLGATGLRGDDVLDILRDGRSGKRNAGLAMFLSLIPGLGQFYCGKLVKAGVLIGLFVVSIAIIGLAPERDEFFRQLARLFALKPVRGGVPAHLSAAGLILVATWLYSVVDAPFSAAKTQDIDLPQNFNPNPIATGDKSGWEP